MPRLKTTATEEVGEYLARHARQDEVLAQVERETAERPDARMQITPDEGGLLTMLARLVGATRALEIGTFTGYSAICIVRGLADGGSLTCLEREPAFAAAALRNLERAGLDDRVDIRVGPAAEALAGMSEVPTFDFAFVDADKTSYPAYYEAVVRRLHPGGLLVLDNVLLHGAVTNPQDERSRTMDKLNARVAADDRVDSVIVLVADGLTLVRRR